MRLHRDTAAVRRVSKYPFAIDTRQEVTAEQLDELVRGVKQQSLKVKFKRVVDGPRYLRSGRPGPCTELILLHVKEPAKAKP